MLSKDDIAQQLESGCLLLCCRCLLPSSGNNEAANVIHLLPRFHQDTTSVAIPITVTGNNIQVLPALESYVASKLEKTLGKLSSSPLVNEIACAVHLSVNKNPKVSGSHTAEVVTLVKGSTIRVVETSPNMFSSVDLVVNRLAKS